MTTEPLRVIYERVCEKHPDFCIANDVEALLVDACVRWLLGVADPLQEVHTRKERDNRFRVQFGFVAYFGPTLAHALLAACEAQEKRA